MKRYALLILTILLTVTVVSAAPNCCVSETSCLYYDSSDISTYCTGDATIVDAACEDVPACTAATGCCTVTTGTCEAEVTGSYQCGEFQGTFDPGVTDPDVCASSCTGGVPLPTNSCDDLQATFTFTAQDILGQKALALTWDTCADVTNTIIERRAEGTIPFDEIFFFTTPVNTVDDTTVEWDTNYGYRITLTHPTGTITGEARQDTGHIECLNKNTQSFCAGDSVAQCSLQNEYSESSPCTNGCTQTTTGATCTGETGSCEIPFAYLNVASQEACDIYTSPEAICYYDRTETAIGSCFSCSQADSCFSFKTETACESASTVCPLFENSGCDWLDTKGGVGDGICLPLDENQNYCEYYYTPNTDERYSPILTPTTHEDSIGWFSLGTFQCTEAGSSCSGATEDTCAAVVTGYDYSCTWTGEACEKSDYVDDEDYFGDEDGPICTNDICERDTSAPRLSVTRYVDYDTKEVTYELQVQDELNGRYQTIPSRDGYTISYCYGTGSGSCSDSWDFTRADLPAEIVVTFADHGIPETTRIEAMFRAIVRDPGYNTGSLVTRIGVVDPSSPNPTLELEGVPFQEGHARNVIRATATWSGLGEGTVTIEGRTTPVSNGVPIDITGEFPYGVPIEGEVTVERYGVPYKDTATVTLIEPEFYIVRVDSPNDGGIPPSGEFTIRVTTSQAAAGCKYAVLNEESTSTSYATLENTLQGGPTVWSRQPSPREASGYLYIHCMQSGTDNEASESLPLYYVPSTEKPQITGTKVEPGSTLVFPDDNGEYQATIIVSTDRVTRCSYDGSTAESDQGVENVLGVTLTESGSPHDIPIICTDAIGQSSDPKIVTITVDPATSWLGFLDPSGVISTSLVPYHIVSSLYAECTIEEIAKSGTGREIEGTFRIADHEDYTGDGIYDLTAACTGYENEDKSGGVLTETISTSFTIDTTAPQLDLRINGYTGPDSDTLTEIPESTAVRFSYSDFSPVTISYEIYEKNTSKTIMQSGTLTGLGTSGDRSVVFNFPLKDGMEYYVEAMIKDSAGNNRTKESSRILIRLPNACDTGELCGPECGTTCGLGDTCEDDGQQWCTTGLTCQSGVCAYEHCTNGVTDTNKGEEGPDCGGVCGACTISLLEPTFGVSFTRTTDVVIGTTESMWCGWSENGGEIYEIRNRAEGDTRHTINDFTIGDGRTINVSCSNDQKNEWKIFTFTWDDTEPLITFYANPNPVNTRSSNPPQYRTEFTVSSSNAEVICRISTTNQDYDDMTEYLGEDYTTDLDEGAYARLQNEWYGFDDPGQYTRYVECIAKNGRETGTKSATFIADPSAKPEPIIRVPEAGRTYNTSITAKVDGQSTETLACWGELEDFGERELTRSPTDGDVFTGPVNLAADGRNLEYAAMCLYLIGPTEVNASTMNRFNVDRTGPVISSVVISDPNRDLDGVSNTLNAVEVEVDAEDAISSIGGYRYTVLVNGATETSGTRYQTPFIVNGLNLSDGDRVLVRTTVYDTLGNSEDAQSNQLRIEEVELPPSCEGQCGGICGPCTGPPQNVCGDGEVQTPNAAGFNEQCDDGSANRDTCTADPGESCTVCTTSCTIYTDYSDTVPPDPTTYCGDGVRQQPNADGQNEQCDFGSENTDTACDPDTGASCSICTTSCQLETFTDNGPEPVATYCGDGSVQTPNDDDVMEACDRGTDENTNTACDASVATCSICTTSCQVRTYYPDPEQEPVCGNGEVETGEECDAGSANINSCTAEPGTSCTVCTSSCTIFTDSEPYVGPACETDADCDAGFLCDATNVCSPEDDLCENGVFDPLHETDIDCGGVCGACEEGASCQSTFDCEENHFCSDGECAPDYDAICSNGELDEAFESGVDCGDICSSLFDQTCEADETCSTNADCGDALICVAGACTADTTAPPVKSWCLANEFNNTIDDAFCGANCENLCPKGVGCRQTDDCAAGLVCDEGTCIEREKTEKISCVPTNSVPPCGGDCEQCRNGLLCFEDSDCQSGNCEDGVCRSGVGGTTQPPPPFTCEENEDCGDGYRCDDGTCVEKGTSTWKWIIFFLLIILLGVAGFIAYKYYYLPSQKPDYQDQDMNAMTMQAGFDETGTSESSVDPPGAPPIATEKQQYVSELIRKKREAEKEQERSELFSAFDESKLDSEPETIDEDSVPATKIESTPDDEKPLVATRKKSHDSFKEILDDAKDELE